MRRIALLAALLPAMAQADGPAIEKVEARESGGAWSFVVTLRHPDTGWDHYADGWRILDMEGNELGMRVLYHPHETEQPFTRSLGGVTIPADIAQVQVQARCNVDGWHDETVRVQLR